MESRRRKSSASTVIGILCVLLAGLGPCTSAAIAQTYLYNRADFAVGKIPYGVVAADFNGDGKLDLAVTNRDDNTVSILLGKPDGTFAAQTVYATGTAPQALVAADFDGDSKMDLAVGNTNPSGPGSVSILLGNGDGTFQSQVDYQVGANPIGIVSSDYNGDKKLDLAMANNLDSTVSILLGNGDGTFQSQTTVSIGAAPVALLSGDFNGDGKLDLITSDSGSSDVTVLLSNGDGTFSRIDSAAGGAPSGIAVGDFNRDGKLDVVVALPSSNPSILLGNGDGSFQPANYINTAPIASLVVAGDFDNDGNLDLAFAQVRFPTQQFAEILRGNGDGTFNEISTSTDLGIASSIFVADFNGDGHSDLAVSVESGAVVSILLGNGNCTFDFSSNFNVSQHQFVGPLVVTDLNGDGSPDVAWVLGYGPTDTLNVLLGDGKGGLKSPTVTTLGAFAPAMVAGDFNGDGRTDFALANLYQSSITLLEGNGDGTFASPISTSLPPSVEADQMAAGDFNGDGRTDLAVYAGNTSTGQSALSIYLAQTDGTFLQGQTVATSAQGYGFYIAVGDFNKDGKLDLAYALPIGGALYVTLGNGDGTFQSPVSFSIPNPNGPPVVSDVNGDGKGDLVVPAGIGFSVLLGNGDGTFQNQIYTQVSEGDVPGHVVVADFNGDGKPDVAADFPFSILLGNGDGTFQTPRGYAAGAGLIGLGTGDFNSDGIPDLVLGNPVPTSPALVDLFLSAPLLNIFPTVLGFGSQEVGSASAPQSVALTNIGNAPLSLTDVTPTGDFSETNGCGGALAVGANCAASVTFTPTSSGLATGTLDIADNVLISPQIIALTGTGIAPVAGLNPGTLTFASLPVGSPSAAQTVTLSNTGTVALTISSVVSSGDFAQTNTCGGSLAVAASCTINVTFTPTAEGSRMGTLTITDNSNGVDGSRQTVALSGTGNGATVGLAPASVTFSGQLVNSTSAAQTVTLTNSGNAALTISGIAAGGAYAQTNTCGTSVAAGANCAISVTFTPASAGASSGALTITDNAPGSPQTVALSGTGTDFTVAPASGSSSTSTVTAGQTATFNLAFSGTAGFSGTAALTCSGAPLLATCTINPSSLALSGTTPADTTVTITTTARGMVLPQTKVIPPALGERERLPVEDLGTYERMLVEKMGTHERMLVEKMGTHERMLVEKMGTHKGMPLLLALAMLAGFAWWNRKGRAARAPALALLFVLMLAALWMPGCGGGGTTTPTPTPQAGTPAGTYAITVTGTVTSGTTTTTHDIKLTLTVN
jgi:FG-GAP-like repeat/Cep192 domain 4